MNYVIRFYHRNRKARFYEIFAKNEAKAIEGAKILLESDIGNTSGWTPNVFCSVNHIRTYRKMENMVG